MQFKGLMTYSPTVTVCVGNQNTSHLKGEFIQTRAESGVQ